MSTALPTEGIYGEKGIYESSSTVGRAERAARNPGRRCLARRSLVHDLPRVRYAHPPTNPNFEVIYGEKGHLWRTRQRRRWL
jgi:hypothetical protein